MSWGVIHQLLQSHSYWLRVTPGALTLKLTVHGARESPRMQVLAAGGQAITSRKGPKGSGQALASSAQWQSQDLNTGHPAPKHLLLTKTRQKYFRPSVRRL